MAYRGCSNRPRALSAHSSTNRLWKSGSSISENDSDTPEEVPISGKGSRLHERMVTTHRKPGRPSKGPRDAIMTKPHIELGALVRQVSEETGQSKGDVIATILADHFGRPELAPPLEQTQEALPLANSA